MLVGNMLRDAGLTMTKLECPDSDLKKGIRLECQVRVKEAPDTDVVVVVTPTDDEGKVDIQLEGIVASKLEAQMAKGVAEKTGNTVTVDCGPRLRRSVPGEKFQCQIDGAAGPARIDVAVQNSTGSVDWRIAPP